MEKIRVGIIGLGGRGKDGLKSNLLELPMVEVTAVCDLYEDRAQEGAAAVYEKYGKHPLVTQDYHDITTSSDVDAV
ncbi:MAG: gfo/Idh/MocA family oxidoreductase, partial [Clostridia bacterium]|nr:gfo/Idh/MocA family oxidoreductase [Clostridia bacterium]